MEEQLTSLGFIDCLYAYKKTIDINGKVFEIIFYTEQKKGHIKSFYTGDKIIINNFIELLKWNNFYQKQLNK